MAGSGNTMRPVPLTTPRAPYDRYTARRGDARGGPPIGGHGHEITPGLVDGQIRESAGAYARDRLIARDRIPVYMREYMVGNDNTLVDWTHSGPVRPSLWMRNHTVRRQVGTDNTRAEDPNLIRGYGSQSQKHGLHTNPAPSKRGTNLRHQQTEQMQPAGVSRLTVARYSGQSYSQTTRVAGG